MHESEKWKWSHSVVSYSSQPHELQPTRLLRPWDFPGKSTGVRVPLPSPTPVLLPGKSHGWRSLLGYSLWGHKESDMTEQLHFHFSLLCIGEGNGNPLQCSCGLLSMGSHRVGHDWSDLAAAAAVLEWVAISFSIPLSTWNKIFF